MTDDRIRTSISVDRKLWSEFQIWVFLKYGNRKASIHVENALREYLEKHREVEK